MYKGAMKILPVLCVAFFCSLSLRAQINFSVDTADGRIHDFRQTIKAQQNIAKYIEYMLAQHHIPVALRNLALIESAFKNKSLSGAGAAGVWQLMPGHAAYYGLSPADRYDVLKSTGAAAQTIMRLYRNYNDWRIVVAAYNCGEGNVSRAIKKAGSDVYEHFYAYLPAETKEHIYKFLLACYATNELRFINLPSPGLNTAMQEPAVLVKYEEAVTAVEISGGFLLPVIAKRLQMTTESISLLNPDFDRQLKENGIAKLILPVDKMPDFLLQKTEILQDSIN